IVLVDDKRLTDIDPFVFAKELLALAGIDKKRAK
ncbi:MAG: hypothetical protein PWQ18_1419, partial [Clostridia bacterium]|nr:hypothetical protein [Clostridia bacterium]